MHLGHTLDGLHAAKATMGATTLEDVMRYLGGKPTMGQVMPEIGKTLNFVTANQMPKTIGRFAGSKIGRGIARAVPAVGALQNVFDVADVLAGDDGIGNKAADVLGMGIGGTLGFMTGGPLGASLGASGGKAIMDTIQGFMGPSEEEKLLAALNDLRG